ncbi:carbamoyl-phosphate synthase arginine-specific small chain, partial [Pavlovales sp. CCMP2436]
LFPPPRTHPSPALPRAAQGTLVLEDGTRLRGVSFGAEVALAGELVFTTGMVGYPETLTDPSYARQMIVMTYPIIGNYGVPSADELDSLGLPANFESSKIHAAALIVGDYSHHHSHWTSRRSLSQWLMEQKIPALYGIDTRLLTKKIREKGALKAKIEFEPAYVSGGQALDLPFVDIGALNLVAEVSVKEPVTYGVGNTHKVLALDCGIKNNIIRDLVARDCEVHVVPWDYDLATNAYKVCYDGLFLSNGPGDPMRVDKTVETIKQVIAQGTVPIFGICMGNQLLARAAGASTFKLPYGNRGQNQPAQCTLTGACYITAQNHGYAVDPTQLPSGWKELFKNINDGS